MFKLEVGPPSCAARPGGVGFGGTAAPGAAPESRGGFGGLPGAGRLAAAGGERPGTGRGGWGVEWTTWMLVWRKTCSVSCLSFFPHLSGEGC